MKKKSILLSQVYQLLEPGPVTMVTTAFNGKDNVMTMTWQMMIDFEPPVFACVISEKNFTFQLLKKTKECVINIPTEALAERAVKVGSVSGRKIDKFEKFHLLKEFVPGVQAPLLCECYAHLACKVIDMKMVKKYNIFILEVFKAWIRPVKQRPRMLHHAGKGVFVIDGKVIKLSFNKK